MSQLELDAIIRSMGVNFSQRQARAEQEEWRSVMAFQSGAFEQYWLDRGKEVQERLEAEYERIQSESSAGDAGAPGGGQPSDVLPADGGDGPLQPPTEEPPPPA